ncbi:MAG: ATP-dependent Clp protease ATP-binding subunit [Prevotellaceae bacterium]|nr:ATP-dependent Clp protease ATP-binding subunit [Candidatus Faecinaster equi]
MNNKYSNSFRNILGLSKEIADKTRIWTINAEHLLLGLIECKCDASNYLNEQCNDIIELKNILYNKINLEIQQKEDTDVIARNSGMTLLNIEASKIMSDSIHEAMKLNDPIVNDMHLLLAFLKNEHSFITQQLNSQNIEYDEVLNTYKESMLETASTTEEGNDFADDNILENTNKSNNDEVTPKKKKKSDTPFLDRYSTDITEEAKANRLDPVVGRDSEIERIIQILSRRKKNNPILIGEPGVGKTAIVEGMAQRIINKKVPYQLYEKRLISLDMTSVVAGSKYRGEFEERLNGIMKELSRHPEIIIFIDEIHTLIGASSAQGSMDAANILKPALSRGKIQCIGATTINEFRKTIEKDGALERRFQKVLVNANTPEETLVILQNIKHQYEEHHNVKYTDKALEACVKLTDRYISDRKLPDKAIDAIDEAGARCYLKDTEEPDEIKKIKDAISKITAEKLMAAENQNFELAAQLRDKGDKLNAEYEELNKEWKNKIINSPKVVDESQVEETVSLMSGVPVQKMLKTENIHLKGLKENLLKNVIAQDEAINKLVKAITRNRIGLRDPNKPIGTFLFLGPTGVGKTFLAKQLAEYMFGTEDALIRVDMSEYMEKHTASRLVGAPPGYVGYEEGGQLTEKVRRRPYSIILLDEIEKAHKDVLNILLQVMDDGRLTDNNGVTVDFKNTIIIITSNCGTRQAKDFNHGIGFSEHDTNANNEAIIMKSLNKEFAPEFLNRLDEIILFNSLDRDAITMIADNELAKLEERTKILGYTFKIDKTAKEFLIDKAFDKQYGARPLKRAIQTYIEDGLSDYILNEDNKETEIIRITKSAKKEELTFKGK